MSTVAKILNHSIFQVEQRGDTLIVVPKGDAIGFSPSRIQVELRAIEKLIDEPGNRHLIVDLDHTNYFGSEMIGHISRLGLKARHRGGRIAICNVSGDMRDILGVMHFEQVWESFETRSQALRAITTVAMKERLSGYRKHMIAALSLAVLALAIVYFPWPNRNQRCYKLLVSYSSQLQENRKLDKDHTNRRVFQKRVQRNLKPLLDELAEDSLSGDLGATYLHIAAKRNLLPLLTACPMSRHELEDSFIANMGEAAKYIKGVTPPTLETFGRQSVFVRAKPVAAKRSAQRSSDDRKR